MKTLLKIIKFLVVIVMPVTALSIYLYNIEALLESETSYIVLWSACLLFVLYNALFYSYYMDKTKIFSRVNVSIVRAFGFFIAIENDYNVQILILCIGIEFKIDKLFGKQKTKTDHLNPQNKF